MATKKKVATQIRLDEDLYELVKGIAEEEMRSINAQMEYFIKAGAERHLVDRKSVLEKINLEESQATQ